MPKGKYILEAASDLVHKYIDPLAGKIGEIDWHLPDLHEDVPITTVQHAPHPTGAPRLTAPARAAPPREKIDVYHGTGARLKPAAKIRYKMSGRERLTEQPIADLPSTAEVVEQYPLGRFSMDKIGTGTGAQMFGHGLYFSEEPKIARFYRHGVDNPTIGGEDAYHFYNRIKDQEKKASISGAGSLQQKLWLLDDLLGHGDTLAVNQNIKKGEYNPEIADWFQREVEPTFDAPGALYHAQLHTSPSQLLGWNDPLAHQPEVMANLGPLLQKYDLNSQLNIDPAGKYPDTGGDLYHMLRMRTERKSPALVANALVGSNVPGIRYTDYGSGPGGTDAQNYVMMNPDLIEIMKRYHEGGAVDES